jgi:5-amino-6-(5-phosphoribosylamino)uracil reductase
MSERPYTVLSCGVSLDGFLDRAGPGRLLLSNPADLDRVDEVRAGCDAILVGAATVRNDDPRLTVKSERRRRERLGRGVPADPAKVTLTERADLDPQARFFTTGSGPRLVYCAAAKAEQARDRLGEMATVVDAGDRIDVGELSADLASRGVRRLMVEGGGSVLTQFLTSDAADELQLVVAPFFVGDARARRFVDDGRFPFDEHRRARLADVRRIDDVVLLRYALTARFDTEALR